MIRLLSLFQAILGDGRIMNICKKKSKDLKRRHNRVRNKITGTAERPRLLVKRTLKNISAQIIDDTVGKTVASATTACKSFNEYGGNTAAAQVIGKKIAELAVAQNIKSVVFDRAGRKYHGRVKALADAAREGGLVL